MTIQLTFNWVYTINNDEEMRIAMIEMKNAKKHAKISLIECEEDV